MLDPHSASFTFLFTDIEGSTKLWESVPVTMADALARHDRLCRTTIDAHGGRLTKMIGDGVHAVFDDAAAAIAASLELQRGMTAISDDCGLPFKMRAGLHAGAAQERDGDYFGSSVNRAARIMGAAHGGQVLLSQAVVDLGQRRLPDGGNLLHLGRVRLRDLAAPEDVWQLVHADLQSTFPALRSLDSTPNNLPQQLSTFVGRDTQLAEIKGLLDRTRLLTLTGSGGCGKTRLAVQLAADVLESYADGVWLVELAALTDPALLPQTVATALGLREDAGKNLSQTITAHLASRRTLLLLDNAEHLIAACAQLTDAILRQCPHVLMLVTSRERLGIEGEVNYRVPSLAIPDSTRHVTPEQLASYESVRLFIDRAQSQLPHFAITLDNQPAVASICSRLDGIPLAIELAAARTSSLSVQEIDRRLDQRFRLLTVGSRTALPRQQTLRSLVDWSYDLLSEAERALLRRLAVFAGGWTLEAAERVCGDENTDGEEVFDHLTALVDKSLVVCEERGGATRYRLLETVRQYARERLLGSGSAESLRDRHLKYFIFFAEEAAPNLTGVDQHAWLERLESEHDNLRAALGWATAASHTTGGLRLAGASYAFWNTRGYIAEGRRWLSALLAAPVGEASAVRGRAVNGAGVFAWRQGDYAAARQMFEENRAIHSELGDRRGVAQACNNLGLVASDQGDYANARVLYEESLALWREAGATAGIANTLNNLAIVAYHQGDLSAARALHEESLALRRSLGRPSDIAMSLNNLGMVACRQRDYSTAQAFYSESLPMRVRLGDRPGIASSLQGLGSIAFALNAHRRAATLWGAAKRLREETETLLSKGDLAHDEIEITAARAAIGEAAFERAQQDGRSMTLEHALVFALEPPES